MLTLLQADQLGISRSGRIHGLESGCLVGEGLLGHGGDGLDGVGSVGVGVATVQQLRGAVGRDGQNGENNLRSLRLEEGGRGCLLPRTSCWRAESRLSTPDWSAPRYTSQCGHTQQT